MTIKIGIIGSGYIAGGDATILARDERVVVSSVYDVIADRAQQFAHAHDATVTASANEVIERSDAVFITTPNTRHVPLALAAINARKHVFCEKPLATTIEDAETVFEKAQRSDSIFQIGHNRRFAPVYATLKRYLSETHRPHSAHVKMNRGELLNPSCTGASDVTGGLILETPSNLRHLMRCLF